MLGQMIKAQQAAEASQSQSRPNVFVLLAQKIEHPWPEHLSEKAKFILEDYQGVLPQWSDASMRQKFVHDGMTRARCKSAHKIVCQGLGDLADMRESQKEFEKTSSLLGDNQKRRPPDYWDALWQLALLVDFAFDLLNAHEVTQIRIPIQFYDGLFTGPTEEVLKHIFRNKRFHLTIESKNIKASDVVDPQTLWFSAGLPPSACPEDFEGNAAPIIFTTLLGTVGVLEGSDDSEDSTGEHVQASRLPGDRQAEHNVDALKAKVETDYDTVVPARNKPEGARTREEKRAFKKAGLYSIKEGSSSKAKDQSAVASASKALPIGLKKR
ncbi:MAG: hypothetical protein Q9159_004629 [Coniocarpon cinnabarinum]